MFSGFLPEIGGILGSGFGPNTPILGGDLANPRPY
jgi:hypothetical protein